jgi:hypothetical protein
LQVKIPDPDFECVSENVLEFWQKGNQTFKKVGTFSVRGVLAFFWANVQKFAGLNAGNFFNTPWVYHSNRKCSSWWRLYVYNTNREDRVSVAYSP